MWFFDLVHHGKENFIGPPMIHRFMGGGGREVAP